MIEELKQSTMADIIQGVLKLGHHINTNRAKIATKLYLTVDKLTRLLKANITHTL